MEIGSFAPTSLERARYNEEQERDTIYNTRMAQLAAEKIELEKRIRALPLNHDFMGEQNPEEALRISKVALQRIEEEKTRLEQGRVGTLALFTQFPEDIYTCILDQASFQTKMALSHVSHAWESRSIESLRHDYDCFIQDKLDEYIQALSKTKDATVSHSSDIHLQEVLLELEAIQKEHILLTTPPTFQNLREKLIEVRNRVFTTLNKLDDVSRIPKTIVPSEQDSRYLPSMAFHFIDVMVTERRGRVLVPSYLLYEWEEMKREQMTIVRTLIKMGDTENALQFIKKEVSNSAPLDCIKLLLDAHDITSAKAIYYHKFGVRRPPQPAMVYRSDMTQSEALQLIAVAEATKDLDRVLQHGNLEEGLREEGLNETLETIATLGDGLQTYMDAIFDLAGAIAEKGDETIAIEFAEKKLREKGIDIRRSPAYARIAVGLAKAGKIDRALELAPQTRLSNAVVDAMEQITYEVMKQKGITKALECLERFPAKTLHPSEATFRTFTNIVLEALDLCTIDDGILTVNGIEDQEIKNTILMAWAKKIVRTGDVDGALRIAHSIQVIDMMNDTLQKMATVLLERGNDSLILKAVDIAEDHITHAFYKDCIFGRIASQLAMRGDITCAKIIDDFIFSFDKEKGHRDIALGIAHNHGVEKALEFINTLSDEEQCKARAALEYVLPPSR